jgi:hypothetical protein
MCLYIPIDKIAVSFENDFEGITTMPVSTSSPSAL